MDERGLSKLEGRSLPIAGLSNWELKLSVINIIKPIATAHHIKDFNE
jgi:hypothetical protein